MLTSWYNCEFKKFISHHQSGYSNKQNSKFPKSSRDISQGSREKFPRNRKSSREISFRFLTLSPPSCYLTSTNSTNCFLFRLEILFAPISIAFNSLLVFCIRSDFWSTKIPLLKIEASVSKASKIMRVAAMQNMTTPSVMDVIRFRNSC